jgi:hypothetical protein
MPSRRNIQCRAPTVQRPQPARGPSTVPVSDWFNPSIAHQYYCSSDAVSKPQVLVRARYMPNDVGSSARNRDTEEICHDQPLTTTARPPAATWPDALGPQQVASRTNEADVKPASTRPRGRRNGCPTRRQGHVTCARRAVESGPRPGSNGLPPSPERCGPTARTREIGAVRAWPTQCYRTPCRLSQSI